MACENSEPMGLRFGLEDIYPKRKFRWLFKISGISAEDQGGEAVALPPKRSSRPNLSFKEIEFQHLTESVWFPVKPEWKTLTLSLMESRCNKNPVFDWIKSHENVPEEGLYNPKNGTFRPTVSSGIKRTGILLILGGCGETLEKWTLEGCYPQTVDWGELDMDSTEIMTVDITLRFERAYMED